MTHYGINSSSKSFKAQAPGFKPPLSLGGGADTVVEHLPLYHESGAVAAGTRTEKMTKKQIFFSISVEQINVPFSVDLRMEKRQGPML
jgi:hypothetical protein